ncbi:MAG: uncharacterized protein PWR03_64 [Tenuifilum sp.]|jgi:predicted DNA-binding protein (UPF0251 family)|uniref:DUF134 domain-containing protein n=1 Tax=Tenuifilum sp. TaxID=2760880 RepID=UPI0024AB1DC0|nr:DUF134 domain-containing protein [Tenuifilum sp.]MDI3525881.1 uncharacterized protein [Tenuifilum sp.]
MPRKKCHRQICYSPETVLFKPAGKPTCSIGSIELELDELEAIRLADQQGLYHEDAAKQMGVSRQTFGRILEQARKKVATAIVNGMAIKINTNSSETSCVDTINE